MSDSFYEQLCEALQRGYVAAFRLLSNGDEAREACQEAATRALAARRRYDPGQPFYPWFYRILKNHCLDRLAQRRRPTTPLWQAGELIASDSSTERSTMANERARSVARAIEELPEELREVIELRHFQDLSYQEMAEILEVPVGTVMSRLYRARKRLREVLLTDPDFGTGNQRGGREQS